MRIKQYKVAVVDDDMRLLESLEDLLESAGYEVSTFSSPQTLIQDGYSDIDCLITDIGMPGMDGFELRDIVKRTRPDLPVFLITGRHELGEQQPIEATSKSGLFRKPFDGPALLAAVGEALQE